MSLYQDLKAAAGCQLDNHESDLYVEATDKARHIVKASGLHFSTFVSQLDRKVWFDIFGAFDPFWEARAPKAKP